MSKLKLIFDKIMNTKLNLFKIEFTLNYIKLFFQPSKFI